MDASDLDVPAAVGLSKGAWITMSAVCVRVNDNAVSDLDVVGVLCTDRDDLSGYLMSDDPGVGDNVVCAPECSQITSADSCGMDLDDRLLIIGFYALDFLDMD